MAGRQVTVFVGYIGFNDYYFDNYIMNQTKAQNHILKELLRANSNKQSQKDVIQQKLNKIQQKTFNFYTQEESQFLSYIYTTKVKSDVLKHRIARITDEVMQEVVQSITSGVLIKQRQQDEGQLQIQIDYTELMDIIPQEPGSPSQKSREKIKQINQDFNMFKHRMQEIKRRQQQKKQQKLSLEQQFRKSLQNEKREEQRKNMQKHIDTLKKQEEERKQAHEKYKLFLKEFKKIKPKHVVLEEEYKQKVELPAIEDTKKKLQMLVHRKKPTLEEINDHDRLYMQTKNERPEKTVQFQTVDVAFKSQFYQQEEDKRKELLQYEQTGPTWDMLEKQKRYSQFVKEKKKPTINPKLRESLQENITKIHSTVESPDRSKIIQVGKGYLQYMRGLQKKRTASTPIQQENVKESRYINYLDELKTKSEHNQYNFSTDWQRDMKDRCYSKLQKREKVLMKSKQLEEKARRDQKLVSHYSFDKPSEIIDKKRQIDDTLLSAIRAKVAVLRDASEP